MAHEQGAHLLREEQVHARGAGESGDEDLVRGREGADTAAGDAAGGFDGDGQRVRDLPFVEVGDRDVDGAVAERGVVLQCCGAEVLDGWVGAIEPVAADAEDFPACGWATFAAGELRRHCGREGAARVRGAHDAVAELEVGHTSS